MAFDTWILSSRFRYQGYYVYARRLLYEFQKMQASPDPIVIRPFVYPEVDNDANLISAQNRVSPVNSKLLRLNRLWRCGGSTIAAFSANADLLFSPTSYVVPLGFVPSVVTIADTLPARLPRNLFTHSSLLRAFTAIAARLSTKIITLSECSKRDLVELYGVAPENIAVIYCGYDESIFKPATDEDSALACILSRFGIRRPYLFHHGTVQPRKNLLRLIEAYSLILQRNPNLDIQLVLAGPLGWQHEPITRAGADVNSGGKVIFTGALSENELATLLKGSLLSVIPSLYEGFCLPMVEAMACGVPAVVANTSCLPEVSGGVLRYFDPLSEEDMANTIEEVIENRDLRVQVAENGLRRAREFSWARCAQETLSVLASTLEDRTSRN